MTQIKLVLIDFDDTLCLTEENGFHLENEAASLFGFSSQSRAIHQQTWGKPLPEVANIRFPGIDVQGFMTAVGKTMTEKAAKQEFDVISDSNLQTLVRLKQSGLNLGIVTSRTQPEVLHLMDQNHPLMSVLSPDDIFYKEKTVFGKPDPKVFDVPLSFYQISANQSVYVGDSVSDAIAAKQAGLGCIISTESKLRTPKDFPVNYVDSFVSKFSQLPLAVDKLSQTGIKSVHISSTEKDTLLKGKPMSVPHDLLRN